jgi:hypothetical protein
MFNSFKIIFQVVWVITWPIHLIFMFTIPDCEKPKFKQWFPLTFLMCIVWIGSLSYLVAWMITIIGLNVAILSEIDCLIVRNFQETL